MMSYIAFFTASLFRPGAVLLALLLAPLPNKLTASVVKLSDLILFAKLHPQIPISVFWLILTSCAVTLTSNCYELRNLRQGYRLEKRIHGTFFKDKDRWLVDLLSKERNLWISALCGIIWIVIHRHRSLLKESFELNRRLEVAEAEAYRRLHPQQLIENDATVALLRFSQQTAEFPKTENMDTISHETDPGSDNDTSSGEDVNESGEIHAFVVGDDTSSGENEQVDGNVLTRDESLRHLTQEVERTMNQKQEELVKQDPPSQVARDVPGEGKQQKNTKRQKNDQPQKNDTPQPNDEEVKMDNDIEQKFETAPKSDAKKGKPEDSIAAEVDISS